MSVLKAERARYALCGRSAGGLGSVHIVYRGHAFTGVGGDAWETNSPRDQMVVTDPETAVLQSDNLNALLALYARLGSEVVQTKFKDVLLDRLDARKGYIDVSYFIFVVLWRVGAIDGALSKSRQALPTGDMKSYGLSNILLVLNGLLKYRHPDFTGDTLDKIESMLHGLDEHQFMISAKIASIRTSRLSTPSESKGSM